MSARFVYAAALGNAEMQTPEDVAASLEQTAGKVRDYAALSPGEGGRVMDRNGQPVGTWGVRSGEPAEPDFSEEELTLLEEALDSHEYWQLSDEDSRSSGAVLGDGSEDPEKAEEIRRVRALTEKVQRLIRERKA